MFDFQVGDPNRHIRDRMVKVRTRPDGTFRIVEMFWVNLPTKANPHAEVRMMPLTCPLDKTGLV